MQKRYLDCCASDLSKMNKQDLIYAIRASEGRVIISESISIVPPLLNSITNAELAASQGADMLLLNMFDINAPEVKGMPKEIESDQVITELQRLTGCVIGVNLEAVDPKFYQQHDEIWQMQVGRAAKANNAQRLVEMGARFLVITGNPNNGVTNHAINT